MKKKIVISVIFAIIIILGTIFYFTNILDINKKASILFGNDYCSNDYRYELAGTALTNYRCKLCNKKNTHSTTATPKICSTCATATNRCRDCGKLKNENNRFSGWEKINIGNSEYYNDCNTTIDLDGDAQKENIDIKLSEKHIIINGKEYVVNKKAINNDYNNNQYHICDLNGDNIMEIIHRTFSLMSSPITSYYTIYNFYNNDLYKVGELSFMGNIPNEIYVKDNTLKFEYWPYESPKNVKKEIVLNLDLNYLD